jgi:hypothetical protein
MDKDAFKHQSPVINQGETLLTAPSPPEIVAEMRRKEEMVERARILVLDVWLEAYKAGELTLEKLCRKSRQALIRIPVGHRERALGQMLDAALVANVPPRTRGNKGEPSALKALTKGLVTIASEEYGHALSRDAKEKTTAFARVAEILTDLGVGGITPRQIEEWYYEVPK